MKPIFFKRRPGSLALVVSIAFACACCTALYACDSDKEKKELPAEVRQQVTEQARKDVEVAARAAAGTMDREGAIIAIRAKEHELRQNGYSLEADCYSACADSLLRAAGVIR